jgi:twitching motility two-component system response regulator PilG
MQAFENMTVYRPSESLEAVLPLPKLLETIKFQEFTGILKVAATIPEIQRQLVYYLGCYQGGLTFVEAHLPSPADLLHLLGKMLKVAFMDTLIEYARSRTKNASHRSHLEAVIRIQALSWESIEKKMIQRSTVLLERLAPYSCSVQLQTDASCDLCYGDDGHGIDPEVILQQIESRKYLWQQFYPTIPSLEAIPCVHAGALDAIHHEATLHHLKTWVTGDRTIADIAEGTYKDSLALASLYMHWVKDGLLGFVTTAATCVKSPVVLTVDDSPIVQAMIRRALSDRYEVISATNALDALSLLDDHDVSLIILDVTMPEMDGFDFCRTIRKIEKFKHIPVIMLTAKDGLIDRARGHMAGTNAYLTKPVDRELLLSTIEKLI